MLSGSLAGVTSVFFTYPLELIRVRLAYETRRDQRASFVRICKQIYHEPSSKSRALGSSPTVSSSAEITAGVASKVARAGGAANFYRGFSPTVLGMLPYAGVSFLCYDVIHDTFRSKLLARYAVVSGQPSTDRSVPLTVWAQLVAGGLAGMIAQTASYPLEVVRRRMQVSGAVKDAKPLGIIGTAGKIYAQKGVRGFFVGLTIGYIKVSLKSC